MNRNWLHPSRPNVPQPPYNLTPDVAPLRQSGRSRANSAASSPASTEMRREAEPEVPKRPSAYASPHHNAYLTEGGTRPAATQPPHDALPPTPAPTDSAPSTGGMRRMTAEDREAYIREVDARNNARQAAANTAGLRPLHLAQASLQVRQDAEVPQPTASAPSQASGPEQPSPEDDAELRRYLDSFYTPAPGADVAEAMTTASSSSATLPAGEALQPQGTYAESAHPPDGWRKPATAIYNADGTPYTHERQPSVTVTPAAPGAAVGPVQYDAANNAIVEVFSNGQVVARISLPYPGAQNT